MKSKKKEPVKKAVAKAKKDKPVLKTITGEKKTLTVTSILALFKRGFKVYRQSNPNNVGLFNPKKLVKYADKKKEIAVVIVKPAK